jgi:hypothetical protein
VALVNAESTHNVHLACGVNMLISDNPGNEQSVQSQSRDGMPASQSEDPNKIPIRELLDVTADDEIETIQLSVGVMVDKLIKDAKRHNSFAALFKLQAVKRYLELRLKYRYIPTIKNPSTRASEAIATSVGKGPYFAKKIRHLTVYIRQFHTLPPTGSGKHHAHPSLLNDERVAQAVRRYLTVVAIGEVRNRLCTIHMDINHFLTR